jgi:hypothetical protein
MQNFKGDAVELKFRAVAEGVGNPLSLQKELFFEDAYNSQDLGGVLYDNDLAPLSNAIPRDIFKESFSTIFDQFLAAGTAESYLFVFRKIFGEDVEVTFTVPDPGKLQIDISAVGIELSNFGARRIEDNAYVIDELVDDEGDFIALQTIKGFQSEYELEQMLFEMVPAGIYTEINLTLGEG